MRIAILVVAAMAVASPAVSQTQQRFYDPQGRYEGRSQQGPGGTVRQYDAQGRYVGQARPSGDGYRTYDAQGRVTGQTRGSGTPVRPVR